MFAKTASCALRRDLLGHATRASISRTSDALAAAKVSATVRKASSEKDKWSRLNRQNNKRALSTLQAKIVPQTTSVNVASKEESREFMAVFPDVVRDLTEAGRHSDIPEVTRWFAKVLQQNVPNGKKNRGLAVVAAYKMLEDPEKLTPENVRLANVLGWCVEMFQSFLIITDDVVDSNETRRNAICWYRNEDIGLKAVNDSLLLENGIYSLLRKHFSRSPAYVPIVELFQDAALKSAMGQTLDFFAKKADRPNLEAFTMSRYDAIVKYRHSYHSFYLPVALALYMASRFDPEIHRQARTILLEMGHFFQVQEDFLNCFGDPAITGKNGTDIKDGRCTWLSVVALQRATTAQKRVFEEYYGRPEPEATTIIKNLYEELSLPITYSIYEEESYKLIKTHIHQISKGLKHEIFLDFMEKLFRREC